MAGVEGERNKTTEELSDEELEFSEQFLKDVYSVDPMLVAKPLLDNSKVVITPQLAFEIQEIYEDIANRYLDLSALFRDYAAEERRKAFIESKRAAADAATDVKGLGNA